MNKVNQILLMANLYAFASLDSVNIGDVIDITDLVGANAKVPPPGPVYGYVVDFREYPWGKSGVIYFMTDNMRIANSMILWDEHGFIDINNKLEELKKRRLSWVSNFHKWLNENIMPNGQFLRSFTYPEEEILERRIPNPFSEELKIPDAPEAPTAEVGRKYLTENVNNGMEVTYEIVSGNNVTTKSKDYKLVGENSAYGRAFAGKKKGDIVDVSLGGGILNFEIVEVS
jgi:hypothetical protein